MSRNLLKSQHNIDHREYFPVLQPFPSPSIQFPMFALNVLPIFVQHSNTYNSPEETTNVQTPYSLRSAYVQCNVHSLGRPINSFNMHIRCACRSVAVESSGGWNTWRRDALWEEGRATSLNGDYDNNTRQQQYQHRVCVATKGERRDTSERQRLQRDTITWNSSSTSSTSPLLSSARAL